MSLTLSEKVGHTKHHIFKAKPFMKAPVIFLVYKLPTGTIVCPSVCKTHSMTGVEYNSLIFKDSAQTVFCQW